MVIQVTRDRMMEDYDVVFPNYGFVRHKGYGTNEHFEAIQRQGPCGIHRMTYKPLRASDDASD